MDLLPSVSMTSDKNGISSFEKVVDSKFASFIKCEKSPCCRVLNVNLSIVGSFVWILQIIGDKRSETSLVVLNSLSFTINVKSST